MYSISPSPSNQTLTLLCRRRSRDFFADHDSGHKFTLAPLRPVTFIFLFCARESSINSMNITCNFVAPAKEHRWHHIWPSSVGSYGLVSVFASLRSPSDSLCWTSFTRTPLRLKSRFSSTTPFAIGCVTDCSYCLCTCLWNRYCSFQIKLQPRYKKDLFSRSKVSLS